ncbi:MAG: ATP-binding protein [Amylibacter sp.]|nr:ATP-binding protein [Amylibacter sp.]
MINNNENLRDTIKSLIDQKKEGTYWDFKLKHQNDNGILIHDILCLANARHDGDRYLIYGVCNKTHKVIGVEDDNSRRSQAKILDLFKSNADKFFHSLYPNIQLETIILDGKDVDVLVIGDEPSKPYSMRLEYDPVRPLHIYTRIGDTNTAKDKSASFHDVEYMWKERFGLTQTPLDRVKIYLQHSSDCWASWEDNTTFYKQFPEFTTEYQDGDWLDSKQEWTRGEIRYHNKHGNGASYCCLKYHQTVLHKVHVVNFDGAKKTIVAPDYKPLNGGRFYYYLEGSIDYAYQKCLSKERDRDHSKDIRATNGSTISIPVLSSEKLEDFMASVKSSGTEIEVITDVEEQNRVFLENQRLYESFKSARNMRILLTFQISKT